MKFRGIEDVVQRVDAAVVLRRTGCSRRGLGQRGLVGTPWEEEGVVASSLFLLECRAGPAGLEGAPPCEE